MRNNTTHLPADGRFRWSDKYNYAYKWFQWYSTFRMLLYSLMLLPEYTKILEESQGPYSRLAHARNVVVHGGACTCTMAHAPHQICTSQDCTAPTMFCRACHTLQCGLQLQPKHLPKLAYVYCVRRKEWTQNSNYNLTFFLKFHFCGWHWGSHHEVLYMNLVS